MSGLSLPQFKPVFCAKTDGTANTPLFIIPSIIAKELLIEFCSTIVPPFEDVTFVFAVTLKLRSSLFTIRGVSNIIFLTIESVIIFAYLIAPEVSLFCVDVAIEG